MSVKTSLDTAECYVGNVKELLDDFEGEFVSDAGGIVTIKVQTIGKMGQLFWNQFRETLLECEGKVVQVQYPPDFIGTLLKTVLTLAGFDLEAPVVIDSPELVPDHIKQQIIEEARKKGEL